MAYQSVNTGVYTEHASQDPNAGTTAPNGKPIVSAQDAADNLHRSGRDWYFDQYGVADDGVLTYGFWTSQAQIDQSYYASQTIEDFYASSYAFPDYFLPFNADQIALAEESIQLWDDLIAIRFERADALDADLNYANTYMPGAGAGAWLPGTFNGLDEIISDYYGIEQFGRLGGDVWVNWDEAGNFGPLDPGSYAMQTMLHETGHAMGLSHVGDYNATDDEDGIPGPDPITYANDAFIYQDSLQYSIMSYFSSFSTGAQHRDWSTLAYVYPSTPMVHDILAIQDIYGADMTTRTGDTVYGFNSTADREVYDFDVNTAPVLAIWDAGGVDTLDFSGFTGTSIINLNEGAHSSGSDAKPTLEQMRVLLGAPTYTQAQYDALLARNSSGPTNGEMSDNIGIAYGTIIENAIGGVNNDVLIGNQVANVLKGGAGNDILAGGLGADELIGGAGADTFVFGETDAVDKIRDFDSGSDRIDLSAFDVTASDVKVAGNNVFVNTDGVKGYELHIVVQGETVQTTDIIFG